MLDLYEFEVAEAATDFGGGGGEAGADLSPANEAGEASPPPAAETETAPAWSPEQTAALRQDPEFREYLAEEAAQIADARLSQMLQQYAQQPQPGQVEQTPEVAPLDPFSDDFTTQFDQRLQQLGQSITQQVLGAVQQTLQPFAEQQQTQTAQQYDALMKDAITDAVTRTGGELHGGDTAYARVLSDVRERYYPEATQRYGETNRAAEIAIEKAVAAERSYQKQIADAALEAHLNRNARLAGVQTEPGTGTSGVQTRPEGPYAPGELSRKYGQQANAIRST